MSRCPVIGMGVRPERGSGTRSLGLPEVLGVDRIQVPLDLKSPVPPGPGDASSNGTGQGFAVFEAARRDCCRGGSVASAARSAATATVAEEDHQDDCDGKHNKPNDYPSVAQRVHRPLPHNAIVISGRHPLHI